MSAPGGPGPVAGWSPKPSAQRVPGGGCHPCTLLMDQTVSGMKTHSFAKNGRRLHISVLRQCYPSIYLTEQPWVA